jgi:hypothetical protein
MKSYFLLLAPSTPPPPYSEIDPNLMRREPSAPPIETAEADNFEGLFS